MLNVYTRPSPNWPAVWTMTVFNPISSGMASALYLLRFCSSSGPARENAAVAAGPPVPGVACAVSTVRGYGRSPPAAWESTSTSQPVSGETTSHSSRTATELTTPANVVSWTSVPISALMVSAAGRAGVHEPAGSGRDVLDAEGAGAHHERDRVVVQLDAVEVVLAGHGAGERDAAQSWNEPLHSVFHVGVDDGSGVDNGQRERLHLSVAFRVGVGHGEIRAEGRHAPTEGVSAVRRPYGHVVGGPVRGCGDVLEYGRVDLRRSAVGDGAERTDGYRDGWEQAGLD